MARGQGFVCYVCEKLPESGRLNIDHEHVRNYKKLPPEKRRERVRGLLCFVCNHYYCGRGITAGKAIRVAAYLRKPPSPYWAPKPPWVPPVKRSSF